MSNNVKTIYTGSYTPTTTEYSSLYLPISLKFGMTLYSTDIIILLKDTSGYCSYLPVWALLNNNNKYGLTPGSDAKTLYRISDYPKSIVMNTNSIFIYELDGSSGHGVGSTVTYNWIILR